MSLLRRGFASSSRNGIPPIFDFLHPRRFVEAFDVGTFSVRQLPSDDIYIWKDIAYGTGNHMKQQLDIYTPKVLSQRAPVLIFAHGGTWQRGGRQHMLHVSENVGITCANRGIIGVVISYRLSPEVRHPEHVRDVLSALKWVTSNIHKYGGNPHNLFLGGHSAGGHLATLALSNTNLLHEFDIHNPLSHFRGVIGMCGVYNLPRLASLPFGPKLIEKVFDPTLESLILASPFHAVDVDPICPLVQLPCLLLNSEEDFHLEQDAQELISKLQTLHPLPDSHRKHVIVPGTNHLTIIATVGRSNYITTDAIFDFIQTHRLK